MRLRTAVLAFPILLLGGAGAARRPMPAPAAGVPAAGVVVVGDKLGRRDVVDFYFPRDAQGTVERVRQAAAGAGLPVRTVITETSTGDDPLHLRLGTTFGEHSGFLARRLPARTLQALDVFDHGTIVLNLHPGAQVDGSPPLVHEDLFARRFTVTTGQDVRYRVPASWLARPLAALFVMLGFPLAVMRAWGTTVERAPGDDVDKVHRIRIAVSLAFAILPLLGALLAVIGGLVLVPDMVLAEVAPAVTGWRATVVLTPIVVLVAALVVTDVAAYAGIQPVDRRLRGTEDGPATAAARLARGMLVSLLPLVAWFVFVGLTPGAGGWPRVVGLVVFLLALNALAPVLVLVGQQTYRLDEGTRGRVLAMCEAQGLRVRDVRAIRARSARVANAMITGILPAYRYVLITDHLLDNLSEDELAGVVAHEVAHGLHHHLLIKNGFWLALVVVVNGGIALPNPAGAVVGALGLPLVVGMFYVLGRVGVALEERADDYACDRVGADPVVRALEKLAALNMTKRRTGAFWDALQQHPGVERRIDRLQARPPAPRRAG